LSFVVCSGSGYAVVYLNIFAYNNTYIKTSLLRPPLGLREKWSL